MPERILDGLKIRDQVFAEIRTQVVELHLKQHIRPGLAAVLVGENPASQLYVKSKIEACHHLGLASWMHTPSADSTTEDLLKLVDELNRQFGEPLVRAQPGGPKGGGASLTASGQRILRAYREAEIKMREAATAEIAALETLLAT